MTFYDFVVYLNEQLWGKFLIFLLCGTGIFFTFYLNGIQFKKISLGFKTLFKDFSIFGKKAGKDGMSSFQALTTAIAAQVGTGNLAGAATALISGGPGAIFWMWISALFGMATNFVEAILAQKYKTTDESGQTVGGPAYYISIGLNNKPLAVIFSVLIIFALGFMGNMVQSNSISHALAANFTGTGLSESNISTIIGLLLAASVGLIIIKGISAIASVAEKVVPIMACLYMVVGIILILSNITKLPHVLSVIIQGAFNPKAVGGGAIGITVSKAMRYGIARGLFSNEAGMGSTPHAHAVAKVEHPVVQGSLGIVAVCIDTFFILNIAVFSVLITDSLQYVNGEAVYKSTELVSQAFSVGLLGSFGTSFISICLLFFAFTTIIGWYYFAETNVRFLFGNKFLLLFKILVLIFVFLGAILKNDLVWELADTFNGLMVIPNLIGLILLRKVAKEIIADYDAKHPKA